MLVEEIFNNLSLQNRLLKDRRSVLRLYPLVHDLLRLNDHQRTPLTESMAARHPKAYSIAFYAIMENLFESINDLMTSRSMASRSTTNRDEGLMGISFFKDLITEFF